MNLHDKLIDVRIKDNELILLAFSTADAENLYYFFRDCVNDQENVVGLEIRFEQTDTSSFKIMIKDLNHGDNDPIHIFNGKIVYSDQSTERYNQLFFFSSIRINEEARELLSDERNYSPIKQVVFASKLDDYEIVENNYERDLEKQSPILLRHIDFKKLLI